MLAGYNKYTEEAKDKARELIDSFPEDFRRDLKLYTNYSNAYDFKEVRVEDGGTVTTVTDFGITCIKVSRLN